MTEGKGGGEGGEDLFEDLDKFFAPIQDVDWPESKEPTSRPEREDEEEREAPPREEPAEQDDTAAFEGPIRVEGEEPEEQPEPGEEPEGGVTSFLFEAEADDEPEGDVEIETDTSISEEAFAQAPAAYVDLPAPEDEDAAAVAELLEEGEAEQEPAPDLEAVEAAADHFAQSVREEARAEGGSTEAVTEEVQIAALLGGDEEELPEAVEPEGPRTVRVGHEGLGGPSWQEPTALEVGAEPERRGPGRDMPMAFLTGLILAGLGIGAIAAGPGPFAVLAAIVVLVAQGEFYFALQRRHFQPATALGLVAGGLVLGAAYYRGEPAMLAMVALSTIAAFLWYMTVPAQHRRNVAANVALTVLGVVYIPMMAGYALIIVKIPDEGRALVMSIIGLAIVYDISAFAVGYFWGSRPLAPHVSPKKSWEGAIGATVVVIAVAAGAVASSVDMLDTFSRSAGLAVVVAFFAPLGDLAESLIKRDLGIKDMGSILPGHGGVLDRIDSILFVLPAAFLYLRLL